MKYIFVHDWKGYKQGDVVLITNSGTARRWLKDGHILASDNPILAINVPESEPDLVDVGLAYRLAQMNVADVETAVSEVDDVRLLAAVLDNDERLGVKTAVQARIDEISE